MAEWRDKVPVVTVKAGIGGSEDEVFTGYSAAGDDSGALVVFEVEEGGVDGQVRRKKHGHSVILANGTWERAESEWQPVGEEVGG